MTPEERKALAAAYADVVSDAEALVQSLDDVVEATPDNRPAHDRMRGWTVPVDALRNEAHRIERSLAGEVGGERNDG